MSSETWETRLPRSSEHGLRKNKHGAGDMAQVPEGLPSERKAQNTNTRTRKKRKNK
jgi:hypothetical protein